MGRWWSGSVGYEIYPRSYSDSNDDGYGDLEGVRQRLPYLEWLGIDAIWLAPFYPSPGFDHGYDVADYRDVNPIHGNLEDFDRLVEEAHNRDIRVIVDLVPNHSSSQHRWFQEALKGKDNPYRDYYIWKDPAPDGGPPNNWVSHFGGPAWTLDEPSGQYWCHLFLPEQPDLNWTNPALADEFDATLRFWCDRGADGFRIDVAHGLMKDSQFRDNPQRVPIVDPDDPSEVFNAFDHLHDLDQDATVDVYKRWRTVVEPYDAILIGESNPRSLDRVARYVENDALHTILYLEPGWMNWKPAELLDKLETVNRSTDTGVSWVIDSHDAPRSATRFGGGEAGQRRSIAVMTFMAALGGFPFLWEGQELALHNAKLQEANLEDPISTRNEHGVGRDVTRTVMPWDTSHSNGFAASAEPWLIAPERPLEETVEGQRADADSWLNKHRALLAVRKSLPDLWEAEPVWFDAPMGDARALRRGDTIAVANLGDSPMQFELPEGTWTVRYDSRGGVEGLQQSGLVTVAAEATYLLSLT